MFAALFAQCCAPMFTALGCRRAAFICSPADGLLGHLQPLVTRMELLCTFSSPDFTVHSLVYLGVQLLGCGRTEVSPPHDSEGPSTSLSADRLGFLSKKSPGARWSCNYTSPSRYHGMTVAGTNPERRTRRRRRVNCWDEAIPTGLRARGLPGAY